MLFSLLKGEMNFTRAVSYIIASLIVVFLTLPFHEFAHAFAAYKLGDRTARNLGRMTPNPFVHIDYMGALALIFFGYGWANPVPINPRNFKNPKVGMALSALAGPLMNIFLAFVAKFLYFGILRFSGYNYNSILVFVLYALDYYSYVNLYLAVFNLIPLPPLDGSRVLGVFLPSKYYFGIMRYERFISLAILLLVVAGTLDVPLFYASRFLENIVSFLPRIIFGF